MCRPILKGEADGVAGGVRLAPHLLRDWMGGWHRAALASTERFMGKPMNEFVGANMSFGRYVLNDVPSFDVELDPGALGYGGETLFSLQLIQSGYHIVPRLNLAVEHHFDPVRLTRRSLIRSAKQFGRTWAYLMHHWRHESLDRPYKKFARAWLRLWYWRMSRILECRHAEGCPEWEMHLIQDLYLIRGFLTERTRRRNYAPRGLVKLDLPNGTNINHRLHSQSRSEPPYHVAVAAKGEVRIQNGRGDFGCG
jgi:hypothetical protein